MVDVMLDIGRKIYGKYGIYGKSRKEHMYICLSKAMYGTLKAALLYYRKNSINPYDPCVTNKCTSKGQLTVVWHVNDMKVPHKNKEEVTNFVECMKGIYGKNVPVVRGKKHNYVVIDLACRSPGEVIVSIDRYTTEAIDEFLEEMMKIIKTPAGN